MSQKAIDAAILAHLCDPDTRNGFELEGHSLRNVVSGRIYPIRDGIPLFISTVSGANLKQMNFYDRVAPMYDLFTRGAREKLYPAAIAELELEPGMRLLEVAIGTGATLPYLPQNVELFGLDISLHMLRKCRKNLEHHDRAAHLFHAEACRLPFREEVFDRVLHIGGIGKFTEPARALKEMVWVSKPGSKIVVVDRIEAQPAEEGAAAHAEAPVEHLLKHLPADVIDVRTSVIGDGQWFCVSFWKPEAAA